MYYFHNPISHSCISAFFLYRPCGLYKSCFSIAVSWQQDQPYSCQVLKLLILPQLNKSCGCDTTALSSALWNATFVLTCIFLCDFFFNWKWCPLKSLPGERERELEREREKKIHSPWNLTLIWTKIGERKALSCIVHQLHPASPLSNLRLYCL